MENRIVAILFVALSVVAIVFQFIGFCAPAWMVLIGQVGNKNPPTTPPLPPQRFKRYTTTGFDWYTSTTGLPPTRFDWYPTTTEAPPTTTDFNWFDNDDLAGDVNDDKLSDDLKASSGSMDSIFYTYEVSAGLWFEVSCTTITGKHLCKSVSLLEIQSQLGQGASEEYLGSFTTPQVLATIALICGTAGTIMTILYSCQSAEKATLNKGRIICCNMAISGLLLFLAVVIQALKQKSMQRSLDILNQSDGFRMEFGFAWALLMSGLGAGLSIVHAIMITLFLCFKRNGADAVPWNRFNNAVI